ncbi:snake venom 5'-nucleotidase-like [Centruroides vittatus]|uniref:snake venom 5'-nucleotidase-like n=1 Tax=Centruroides vittatus TaxID=120091 RepID=UPI00350ECC4B
MFYKSEMWFAVFTCMFITLLSSIESYNLTVLHTNDFHSRYEEINNKGGKCKPEKSCYGGIARQVTAVRNIRNTEENVIFLNAGDYYQGTVWYTVHRWRAVAEFTNRLHHDAMALGNHEFDDGVAGLVPFLDNVTFPIISSNINISGIPELEGKIRKSVILDVGGEKIGVVGYTTKDTPELAKTGPVTFFDEVESIREEADILQQSGINIIIAVGHAGFLKDKEIAEKVPSVDVVVGGHTNTFLYTGEPPIPQLVEGPYPVVVERSDGSKALVVQDYAFGLYLGHLKVTFDEAGNVISWEGNPILMDETIPQDNETAEVVETYKEVVDRRGNVIVGQTNVYLNADRPYCRMHECNFGNVITDAVLRFYLKKPTENQWNTIAISIFNSGGIRDSISEKENDGNILMRDVMNVLPYLNTLDVVDIYGKYLIEILERSVYDYGNNPEDPPGRFLQVSGVRVTYNISQPPGQRVHKALVHCTFCRVPRYLPINESKIYRVVMPTYLTQGGDDYKMIPENTLRLLNTGSLDIDIVVDYLNKSSPIVTGIEGRINFVDPYAPCNGAALSTINNNSLCIYAFLTFSILLFPGVHKNLPVIATI